jgi:acetate kinase
MMGTRSGDVDPSLIDFLARREGIDTLDVVDLLNTRSGLLGVSGESADMRDLYAAASGGHARAELAIEMFCYRISKQIGAYAAALGALDAVVFGGGIGENAPDVRSRICSRLGVLGISVDETRNIATIGIEGDISDSEGRASLLVSISQRDADHCRRSVSSDGGRLT